MLCYLLTYAYNELPKFQDWKKPEKEIEEQFISSIWWQFHFICGSVWECNKYIVNNIPFQLPRQTDKLVRITIQIINCPIPLETTLMAMAAIKF